MIRSEIQLKSSKWVDYTGLQKSDIELLSTRENIHLQTLREALRQ